MDSKEITFNDLPKVIAELRDEVSDLKKMLVSLMIEKKPRNEDKHVPMSVEQASEYLKIPRRTLYMKLKEGLIPASKPGKRYVIYRDELDTWIEVNRKNPVPLSIEEENSEILSSFRRKPNKIGW